MLTAEQRQLRAGLIGASDAPAVCGVDPYSSVADVWARLKGLVRIEENDAMRRGSYLEGGILNFAETEIGRGFSRDIMIISNDGIRAANFDGVGDRFVVEVKTSKVSEDWGDSGSDEVPDRVRVQVAQQMSLADELTGQRCEVAYVAALIAMDLRLFVVERDDALVDAVRDRVQTFGREALKRETPPEGDIMSLDVLARLRRVPNKTVPAPVESLVAWSNAKKLREAAEKVEDDAKAALIQSFGDAEAATAGDITLTFFEQSRQGVDAQKLRREHPEIYEACLRTTSFRVLRERKNKQLTKGA